MTLLIPGLALWWASHLLPMLAPGLRARLVARLGEGPWKGLFSLVSLGALVLMVQGYQAAEVSPLYTPPAWGLHFNNFAMLAAVFVLVSRYVKGRARRTIRHPMLWSVVLWSAAHLMVRGDLASAVLWGGMGLWALAAMLAINARDGAWTRPGGGTAWGDLAHLCIAIVVFAAIAILHWKVFGLRPFAG